MVDLAYAGETGWYSGCVTLIYNTQANRTKRKQLRHSIPETEVIMWSRLQGKKLFGYKFRRQYSVGRYVVDFYCAQAKLAIEIDGDSHFTDEAEKYDLEREKYISSIGIRTLRFTNLEVRKKLNEVLEKIFVEIQNSHQQ